MDPKNLSKQKYIYRLYLSYDDKWHVEKYPIVYVNSAYVYFKIANKQELDRVEYTRVLDHIDSSLHFTSASLNYRGWYFWNDLKVNNEIIKDLRKKSLEKRMRDVGTMIYARYREIEQMENEVDQIKKELEALNGTE